jgi:hypothetical protein
MEVGTLAHSWHRATSTTALPSYCGTFGGDPVGQLHSSLNGGSDEQGGMDELLMPPPAAPLDADTPLDAAPLLDVDTRRDP